MKKCKKCFTEKTLEDFQKCSRNKDGRTSMCKSCKRLYDNEHYKKNIEQRRPYITKNISKRREAVQDFVKNYLITHPCVDCGNSNLVVLEFDHIDPVEKDREISKLIAQAAPLDRIEKEIKKCEVRCANCHRIRTAKQFGWAKSLW